MARRRMYRRAPVWLCVLVLTACAATASTPAQSHRIPTRSDPARVDLFGDSLAYQAEPYFNTLMQAGGKATVTDFVFGGTATCDWLSAIRRAAGATKPPDVAVMEFSGNTFTECMRSCPPESSSAITRYCADMTTAIRLFLAVGTHVYLEGTPINSTSWVQHDPHWADLNRAFAGLAGQYPGRVTYVDAGSAVEGKGHAFVRTLPCLRSEPCTGPSVNGVRSNVVRSPDGVHFCPVGSGNAVGQVGTCPVYSSGAYRFAAAMAGPVIRAWHLGGPDPAV